jgi:pre-B-cell leukemia transcription factor 4
MLVAEGIAGPYNGNATNVSSDTNNDHPDYRNKLARIRSIHNQELDRYKRECNDDFMTHVKNLLREQSFLRPITPREVERMMQVIHKKFGPIEVGEL